MEKILCGRRIRNAENHWQEIDVHDYKITKPTFLVFGGNLTTHPEQANSYAKIIYKLLNKINLDANNIHLFEDFDCLSFYYNQNLLMCTYNRRSSGQMINYNVLNEVDELYDCLVRPLVEQEIALAKSSKQNVYHPLANLILFGHSAGSQIAYRLEELIKDRLLQELDEETSLNILKNVKYYGFASYAKVSTFDATYIQGTKDVTTMDYYPAISFNVESDGEKNKFNYYSCESPLYLREKQQSIENLEIVEVDELAEKVNPENKSFEELVDALKSKIVLDNHEMWQESLIGDSTFEINSVKYANLDNGGEKVILASMGHDLLDIVGNTSVTNKVNTDNNIEDMFIHSKSRHAFNRKHLDLFDFSNLAYITLSDDMTETLKHKCELNKTNYALAVKEENKTI